MTEGTCGDSTASGQLHHKCEEQHDGSLQWSDGSLWVRPNGDSNEQRPALEVFAGGTVKSFCSVARDLYSISAEEKPHASSSWPFRLVPLRPSPNSSLLGLPNQLPFDLEAAEAQMAMFCSQLTDAHRTSAEDSDYETDDQAAYDSDKEDDDFVDTSQEAVNEDYMWRLAQQPDFPPSNSKYLVMPESSFAIPTSAVCVECQEEGKTFSKTQMNRHMDHRTCQDCLGKRRGQVYKPPDCSLSASAPNASGEQLPAFAMSSGQHNQVSLCSVCKTPLTKLNTTQSQRNKSANKKKCKNCVDAPG